MSTTSQTNQKMNRTDYRKVKQMNNGELTAYMNRIYMRGYKKGVDDSKSIVDIAAKRNKPDTPPAE